jgi:hypothetical protein
MTWPRDGATLGARTRRVLAAQLVFGAVAVLAVLLASPGAGASGGGARATIVLGKTPTTPDASCPESPCRAVGRVTGFQVGNEEGGLPFRVPRDGRIVAWTITVSEPTPRQRSFFNGFFGRPPEAHLAILRKVPDTRPPQYRLRRQSGIRVLSAYLGQTVRFRLGKPLRVRRGDVVGISIPTWASGFAFNLPTQNAWRASRERGECINTTDLRQSRPQQVVGSKRSYGCRYSAARLLYTATLVTGR